MRARYLIAATCGLLLTCLTSCTVRDEPGASARVSVFVSILPQAYFVERIGGERVSVQTLIAQDRVVAARPERGGYARGHHVATDGPR
jgi:ABC-type Zn uptake system ZnuABC Zn-binding protein ZnuA